MPKYSASDAISPAAEQTRKILLEPFRWGVWLRYGVIGLFVQQFGCNANFNLNNLGNLGKQPTTSEFVAGPGLPEILRHMEWSAALIATLVVLGMLLVFVHVYVGAVCRFMLLESVLRGTVRLRESWARWHEQGLRLFGMQLGIGLLTMVVAGVLIGVPVVAILAVTHKSMEGGGVGVFLLLLFMIPLFLLLVLAAWILNVLVNDFALPVMALEGAGAWASLGRAWQMARAEMGGVAFYLFLRFVLVLAAAIIFGIIGFFVSLVFLAPVIGIGAAVILGGAATGLSWTPLTVALAVVALLLLLLPLMYVLAVVRSPGTAYFQAYALQFVGGRYEPLGALLWPPPPPMVVPGDGAQ